MASGGGGHGSKITRNADIRSMIRSTRVIVGVRIMLSSWEPPIGIEPMTYALRGARARAAHALAAPIAPATALMTPAALELSGESVHESVHGPRPPSSPVSPSSPKPAALTSRSPTPSTPGDSGRPSGQPIPGGQACTLVSQRNIRETAIKNAGDSWDALKAAAGGGLGHLDSAQSSTPTSCLQEVRSRAPSALAAPMAQAMALTAPAALGLSGGTFHEQFH